MPDKYKTSISLDEDVYKKILNIAEEEDRNFSSQVNKILKDYIRIKEYKEKQKNGSK